MNSRTVIKALFGLALSVQFSSVALAQPAAGECRFHAQKGAHRLEMLKERLQLSDDQANRLGELMASRRGACRSAADDTAKQECRMQMRAQFRTEVQSILTPEQQQQFQQLREERRAKRQAAGGWQKPQV